MVFSPLLEVDGEPEVPEFEVMEDTGVDCVTGAEGGMLLLFCALLTLEICKLLLPPLMLELPLGLDGTELDTAPDVELPEDAGKFVEDETTEAAP